LYNDRILPDRLELFGSEVAALGGASQSMAGALLALSNLIAAEANRLSIINIILSENETAEEAKNDEVKRQMEKQLDELKGRIREMKERINHIEDFIRKHD
jgi:DNA anti-recombination protein RmuC